MDDTASKENPSKDFNKLDLSQLQGFSFGTQWTQDKEAARDHRREGRARQEGGELRRDRRSFRKPAGGPPHEQTASGTAGEGGDQERAPRRDFRPGGGESRGPGAGGGPRRDFRGGPRREGQGGGERGGFRGGFHARRDAQPEHRGPYLSPFFTITFYPEDGGFSALAKAIRNSCRTYELFEIARVIIGKTDRFVATIQRKQPDSQPQKKPAEPETAAQAAPPAKLPPLAISLPDGLPFENEDAAIAHVLSQHLDKFFDSAEVEVEPPKGNFLVINKCGITGELLGPPNYHRYNQIVQQHQATRVPRMPFEVFRNRIETVRDPEIVNQWLEKMKKTTRYTWKFTPPAEGAEPLSFDSLDDARAYLIANARDKVVKLVETARFHGKLLDALPQGEIRRSIEGALERQRRFPLDTANALRGRLRREGFTIFKKGSKSISYVCAVKRKFRVPGQTFSDSIGALIAFIEANPMVRASELPVKFLGIQPPPQPAAPAPAGGQDQSASPAAADASAALPSPSGSVPPFTGSSAAAATELSAEDKGRLHALTGDLHWLVSEGYVTEFIDGRLFAPPPMTEARKQEVEKEEHDPENFPEAPASEEKPAPASAAPESSGPAPAESEPPPAAAAEPVEPSSESLGSCRRTGVRGTSED